MNNSLLILLMLFPTQSFGLDFSVPETLRPSGQYVTFTPKQDVKSVTYIGLSGVDPIPSQLLKDETCFLLDIRGLTAGEYKFVAVASADDVHVRKDFRVIIGDMPVPPNPTPTPTPNPVPPNPTPVPPIPVPTDVVSKASYDAAVQLLPIAKNNIPAVVAAYEDVLKRASNLEPGYLTINEIQAKLQAARSLAMGDPASWTGWMAAMQPLWDNLWKTAPPKITVLEFHRKVVDGLKAVR